MGEMENGVINLADMTRLGLVTSHSLPSMNKAINHCPSRIPFLGHQLLKKKQSSINSIGRNNHHHNRETDQPHPIPH